MQAKGIVRFFTIALILVCIFQLSFTFITRRVESNAQEMAEKAVMKSGNASTSTDDQKDLIKKKRQAILDSMGTVGVYHLGFKNFTYSECKEKELNLGLDLKGGMSVVLQVSEEDVVSAMADHSMDPAFTIAMEKAKAAMTNSQNDFVTEFGIAFKANSPNARLAAIFSTPENQGRIKISDDNDAVLKVIKKEVDDAVGRTYQIINARIDKFGVSQPTIALDKNSGRISVELAGVDNPERVRKYLQASAKLEFWETYENEELINQLVDANKALSKKFGKKAVDTSAASSNLLAAADSSKSKKDTTAKKDVATLTPASGLIDSSKDNNLASAKDTAKKSKEEELDKFNKENVLFSVMGPALTQDEKGNQIPMKGPIVGYVFGKDTAKVSYYLSQPEAKAALPKNVKFLFTAKPFNEEKKIYQLIAIKMRTSDGKAPLGGEVITDARQDIGQNNTVEIAMQMNQEGADTWRRLTSENIKKSIAIVLDNVVYSFPTVQGEISGGRSSITGSFTTAEAQDLASILKAGKLPAPARIIEESVVGPTLGAESIKAGFGSFMIAFVLIVLLMLVYYNTGGAIANISLVLNLFFTIGVLAGLGFTLTMPGIAGLVLTIGMAVDTNVIIFERIKEELLKGKGTAKVVEDGYKASYAPIIDAHITMLLTGVILAYFGLGPVLGFATTLIIGIILNLFCGILITRLVTDYFLNKEKHIKYVTGLSKNLFHNFHFKFVEKRKIAFVVSGILTLIGLYSMITKGFDYGVEFLGGRTYIVRFEAPQKTNQLHDDLKTTFNNVSTTVKSYGAGEDQFQITTAYMINDNRQETDSIVSAHLFAGLQKYYGSDMSYDMFAKKYIIKSSKVGPTIADDIKKGSIWATIVSLIAIFIYILIRFRKWQYGLGTIIALFHDVLIVMGAFSIFANVVPFTLEIDQQFIAAILTIIGFSMNDTVIVFDRIREYLGLYKGKPMKDVINDAINHTISRTIMTSATVFVVVLILFIFGGEVTRGFAFAMLIGVITGTYSSIFIAMPVLYDLQSKEDKEKEAAMTAVGSK